MKVLHSCPPLDPSWGGPFWSVRGLAKALVEGECSATVKMPYSAAANAAASSWEPATLELEGEIRIPALGWSPHFEAGLLESSADILHTHGLWLHPSWVARRWKRRLGRPHVASIRGMLEPWAFAHRRWKKWPVWHLLEKSNLRSASLLHATSSGELASIRRLGLRNPVAVIPNGVDVPHLPLEGHVKPERFTAISLGRLHPVKGLDRLLRAWAEVAPQNWDLVIAGPDEGGHQAQLELISSELGLERRVRFCGSVRGDTKRQLLCSADLFIAPSHSENFGIAIAEALAHGLAVLTTHGTPWHSLETHHAGWWVANSLSGITDGLAVATSTSRGELETIGRHGRKLAMLNFSWTSVADQFTQSYRWLLEGGEPPEAIVFAESEH